ncbi:MAG: tetratricopeptide repeat protein [Bacillota bacterium]
MQEQARYHAKLAVQLADEGQWSAALEHAHACRDLALAGSSLSVWALHALACIYADAGRSGRAQRYARAYLAQVSDHPSLERFTPFVLHAMGSAYYQVGRWPASFHWFNRALVEFARLGYTGKVQVTSVNLAWTLIRMGRPAAAQAILPSRDLFPADLAYTHDGAQAAILAAGGQYQVAVELGRLGLSALSRRSCDFAEAAEVALVVARALRSLGENSEASAYIRTAAELCALQRWDAVVRLLLSERAGGGELPNEPAASSRGSADLHHLGCFSTGVA